MTKDCLSLIAQQADGWDPSKYALERGVRSGNVQRDIVGLQLFPIDWWR